MSKSICIITGAGGLIGSEAVKYFSDKFDQIIGIDNDSRAEFFGESASVRESIKSLEDSYKNVFIYNTDITNQPSIDHKLFMYGSDVKLIIHCAAQPSHDWAAKDPMTDFQVNAVGTLNLLEAYHKYCPEAVFIFTSTNKVYGDSPNRPYFDELETRYEPAGLKCGWKQEIDESQSIDQCLHSLFGVSKASADLLVQEYGRYFGLKTGVFRGGCLTGPGHKGAELHGFLSYLIKCIKHGTPYTIYGFFGKQVRDVIHSFDVVRAFDEYYKDPKMGEVYNIGGGRHSNCSVLEAITMVERKLGRKAVITYNDEARIGDHQWYITDMSRFKSHYPEWNYTYTLDQIIDEIIQSS